MSSARPSIFTWMWPCFATLVPLACSSGASTATGSFESVGSGATDGGPGETCNDGAPDGRCNAQGAVPETCECFDCANSALCLGRCDNDGTCGESEDCSCDDCYGEGCLTAAEGATTTTTAATTSAGSGGSESGGASGSGGSPTTGGATSASGGAGGATGGSPATGGGGQATGGSAP